MNLQQENSGRIAPRRLKFDWSTLPMHWVDGDPQTTHTINVLHLLLPAGESWFIQAVRDALPHVNDPELRAQIRGFMGQESTHDQMHTAALAYMAAHGLETGSFTKRLERFFQHTVGPNPLGKKLPSALVMPWLRFRLAAVAGIEHYTCVMGDWLLHADALHDAVTHKEMINMLDWHAAEEVEHRSVVFDTHVALGGTRLERNAAMTLMVTPILTALWVAGTIYLMKRDRTVKGGATFKGFFDAVKQRKLPTLKYIYSVVPAFYSKRHHPRDIGDDAAAAAVFAKLVNAR